MKNNKLVVFDFDGTLVDSLDPTLLAIQELQEEFKLQPISRKHIRAHHLKDGLRLAGLSPFKLASYIRKLKKVLQLRAAELRCFPGMSEAVLNLHANAVPMAVVSSNAATIIRQLLAAHKIDHCFEEICADSSVFGKHRVLQRFCKRRNVAPIDVLYIGDELRDVDATQKLGMPIVVVDWGWNDRALFATPGAKPPEAIVSTPQELLIAINNWLA